MSSENWQCPSCNLVNKGNAWSCIACYTQIKEKQITVPEKMRALKKLETQTEGYTMEEGIDVPEPGEGELLVKSYCVGICGSDMILYKWTKDAATIAERPFIPGHETAGLVVKAGKGTRLKVGSRVAIENHFYCGECFQCTNKRGDICMNMGQFGHGKGTKQGGCAEYFVVKEIYCYRLRTKINWREAALLEPMGVAHNGLERLEVKDEDVLVIGCGAIGLLAISIAKALGAKKVIASDVVPHKLEVAQKMGADIIVDANKDDLHTIVMDHTKKVGIGRILECSGNSNMTNNLFKSLRKGGHIVLIGLPKNPLHVENVLPDIIFKSIQLRTVHGRRIFSSWKQCEALVNSGKVNVSLVISDDIPMSKFEEAHEKLASGKSLKIVMDPTK